MSATSGLPEHGPVAFVTGGGRGIGRAIAETLAAAGHAVAVAARTKTELDETRAAIAAAGGRCEVAVVDVTDADGVAAALAAVDRRFGTIDVLVNCAGTHPTGAPVEEYPVDYWNELIAVNLSGAFHTCRAAVPAMKAAGHGTIVNVASVAARTGVPDACGYAAAKAGLVGLTRALAAELGPSNITVNVVCPGFVETRMTGHKHTLRQRSLDRAVLHRVVPAEDVASLVSWLAGPAGRSVTGQVLGIDAGFVV